MLGLRKSHDLPRALGDVMSDVVSGKEIAEHTEIMHHHEGFDFVPGNRALSAVETGLVYSQEGFKDRGQWADNSIEPTPGMIIFFDWDSPNGSSGPQDGQSDHVGIVEKCENGIVYTIEGNSGDSCRQRQYSVGYYEILDYGIHAY